ncbi:MAG: hypothetical protein A2722_01650 [Candidatus Doudnabacteria bacterium RIFCSPHIGHO2_01_FULL_50_11]|uniref:Uncharacterized protein n=1 Tax=Candidatus Doudnabacteria bacterium RIFCSPHIGHO2_01_FULL_50_11 TaxID=1817828 RepID=A0A1F5PE94_9BACT|nr:MAG: hypothetical protein A2722_01650 [Candidatus Doudnabacteria bacterium RIFCSPHIGHO2_01_FULL_50_11]HLC44313.1 hypothetical protein [Patescibacteria group bacterium]
MDANTQYQIPLRVGSLVDGLTITEIGESLIMNDTALVAVRLADSTHRLVSTYRDDCHAIKYVLPEAEQLVRNSSKMPAFRQGPGSGVFHVWVWEGSREVFLKLYYNDKAGRQEEISRK